MKKNIIITIVLIIIAGGAGFFGGMKYQENKQPTFFRQFTNRQEVRTDGQFQGNVNRTGFRPVSGEIASSDENSITVKLQDGSSKIIILSEKTEINKADKGEKKDLKVGEKVMVMGQENSDGSVTAQNIQLNPITRTITGMPGQTTN